VQSEILQVGNFSNITLILRASVPPAGVLPWAAATHCAFGLWMHTRFQAGHVGGEQISDLANRGGAAAVALSETYYFQRITQANGLPLLVLLIVHLGVHVFIR
jgi:hypothetical protein